MPLTLQRVVQSLRRTPVVNGRTRGSVHDVVCLVNGTSRRHVSFIWQRIVAKRPEWAALSKFRFGGPRAQPTPAADLSVLIEIVWACGGKAAYDFRQQCATLITRYFEGDEALADDIEAHAIALDVPPQDDAAPVEIELVVVHDPHVVAADDPPARPEEIVIKPVVVRAPAVVLVPDDDPPAPAPAAPEQQAVVVARAQCDLQLIATSVAQSRLIQARAEADLALVAIQKTAAVLEIVTKFATSPASRALAGVARENFVRRALVEPKPGGNLQFHERVTVQMVVDRMRDIKPASTRVKGEIGRVVAKAFQAIPGNGQVVRGVDGTFTHERPGEDPAVIESSDVARIQMTCRIRHSVVYGITEVHTSNLHDVWTYPAEFESSIVDTVKARPDLQVAQAQVLDPGQQVLTFVRKA